MCLLLFLLVREADCFLLLPPTLYPPPSPYPFPWERGRVREEILEFFQVFEARNSAWQGYTQTQSSSESSRAQSSFVWVQLWSHKMAAVELTEQVYK